MRLTHLLIAIFSVLVIAAIFFPVYSGSQPQVYQTACLSKVKQQGMALLMYADDSGDRLPPRDFWMDTTQPYTKGNDLFKDSEGAKGGYGYAFNASLDRRKLAQVQDPAQVPATYDSVNPIRNASDPFASLPRHGRHPAKEPKASNIGYADGHAKSKRMTP